MAITYEIIKPQDILKFEVDSPPSVDDYQAAMPGLIKLVTSAKVKKWLIIVSFGGENNTPEAMSFTSFAFNDLKKFIDKVAVVCSSDHRARMSDVLSPLQNQGKEVAFFTSGDTAVDWLTQ